MSGEAARGPRKPTHQLLQVDIQAVGVFLLALCVRCIHIWFIRNSPFFSNLVVDSVDFDARAMAFLNGSWPEAGAFYQPPFYPLFLSLIYMVFGHSVLAARLVQAFLGSFTATLVYCIGRRCCGRRAGLIAGIIAALYSMAVYFDTEILAPALLNFFTVLSLHLLLSAADKGGLRRYGGAGLSLGLGIVTWPAVALYLPLAALWVVWRSRRDWAGGLTKAAVFSLLALIPVAGTTALNYARSGDIVLVSYNGGLNFYLGNNPEYDRTVAIQPGIRWDLLTMEPPVDREADPSGWSRYYYEKSADYMLSDPVGYVGLLLKKLILFWNSHEIERNVDFSHSVRYSPFMAHPLFSFAWVAPLALVGMVLAWRRRTGMGLLALYLISQVVGVVAFFVCARYRMTAMPPLFIFAGFAAVELFRVARRPRSAAFYLGGVFLCALGVNCDPYGISQKHYARADYELALVLRREHKVEEARRLLERAQAADRDDPDPPFQLGATLAGSGRHSEAAAAFAEAARREPRYARTWFNVGLSLLRAGENAAAAEACRQALDTDSSYWEAAVVLGEALEKAGRPDQAAVAYRTAAGLSRDGKSAAVSMMNAGRMEALVGMNEEALADFDSALAMDPGLLEARLAKVLLLMALGLKVEAKAEVDRAAQSHGWDPRVRALLEELGR